MDIKNNFDWKKEISINDIISMLVEVEAKADKTEEENKAYKELIIELTDTIEGLKSKIKALELVISKMDGEEEAC